MPRHLGDAVRRRGQLEAGLDDRGADRIVAAAGAQRRDRALIVAPRVAERVGRQSRVMELGLGDVGHQRGLPACGASLQRRNVGDRLDDEPRGDRRAVVMQDRHQLAPGRCRSSLMISARICASRFCSTTNTFSWSAMKSTTSSANGKPRNRSASRCTPRASSASKASSIATRGRAEIDARRTWSAACAARFSGCGTRRLAVSNLCSRRCMLST